MKKVGFIVTMSVALAVMWSCLGAEPVQIDLAGTWHVTETVDSCPGIEALDILVLNPVGSQITTLVVQQDQDVLANCALADTAPREFPLNQPLDRVHDRRSSLETAIRASLYSEYELVSYTATEMRLTRPSLESNGEAPGETATEVWVKQ